MNILLLKRLSCGMLLTSLTLGISCGGTAHAEDYSLYNADNKQVFAAYFNEDLYIIENQFYGSDFDGAITPVIPVEIRGYSSREPGTYKGEGKLLRFGIDDHNVDYHLINKSDISSEPTWFDTFYEQRTNNYLDFDYGQHPRKNGLAYRLHTWQPQVWFNGYWQSDDYLYADPDSRGYKNYTQLDKNVWQIRIPGEIQFFKYGELAVTNMSDHKAVPFPLDINPDTGMFRLGGVAFDYFGQNNTFLKGGPNAGFVVGAVYVIGNIHFVHKENRVVVTGNQLSASKDEITIRDSDPIGATIGKAVTTTFSFPFNDNAPIASLRLSNATSSRTINGIRVFNTDAPGIGYQLTDKDGKEFSPASAVVQGGNLTVLVNLTFIKTGEIMSGTTVSKLDNMGKLMVITGKDINERVLYNPNKPLAYDGNAKVIVPALGCD